MTELATRDVSVVGAQKWSLVARLALWFATAYTIVILVHEGAHAIVARMAGLHATMFHFWVDIDRNNSMWQRAAFGTAGPASSLILGLVAWLGYRRGRGSAIAVPLLFLAVCGVSNFFGNLMSTAFVGDFSNVALWLGLPTWVRYALSVLGLVMVGCVLFLGGYELCRGPLAGWSRIATAGLGVVVPVALGTMLVVVINQPVAIPGFAAARFGEAAFWMFAAAGAALPAPAVVQSPRLDGLSWPDVMIALVVLLIVRLLVPGVPLP